MGKTVLIVDDSVSMRQMVAFTLQGAGFDVIEAGDGKEAVSKLNGGAKPNLVITDLNMPKLTGIQLTEKVREKYSAEELPILLITTQTDKDETAEAYKAGISDVIYKPFTKEHLKATIDKLIS